MIASAVSLSTLGLLMVICLTTMIYSFIYLVNLIMTWIGHLENGSGWQIGVLSLSLVLSSAFFSYLIKGATTGPFFYKAEMLEKITSLNIPRIAFLFTSGIIDGLNPNHNPQLKTLKDHK